MVVLYLVWRVWDNERGDRVPLYTAISEIVLLGVYFILLLFNFRKKWDWVLWTIVVVVVLLFGIFMSWTYWEYLHKSDDSVSTTVSNLGLVIGGVIAILFAIWRSVVSERQTNIAQMGLLNERLQKGVEMLGSDVLSVRMGGIYALRNLAKEHSEIYYIDMMRLLCAFARNPAIGQLRESELVTEEESSGKKFLRLREDVQAVMNVIRYRSDVDVELEESEGFRLQLERADLRGAVLSGANLRNAFLWGANLSGGLMSKTFLDSAVLTDANLSDAQFSSEGADPARGLGRVHTNASNMRASMMKPKKSTSSLSKREKIRRKPFRRRNRRSTSLRLLYNSLSYSHG